MAFLPLVIFVVEVVQGEVAALQRDGESDGPPTTSTTAKVLADICFLGGQICVSRTSYYIFMFFLITFFVLMVAFIIFFVIFLIKTKILSRPQRPRTRLFERLEEVASDPGESVGISEGIPETSTPVRPSSASLQQAQELGGVGSGQQGPAPECISPNNVEIHVRSIGSSGSQSSDSETGSSGSSGSSYSSQDEDDNLAADRSNASRFHG